MKIVLYVAIPWQMSQDKGEFSCCLPHEVIGLSLFLTLILFLVTFHKNLDMQIETHDQRNLLLQYLKYQKSQIIQNSIKRRYEFLSKYCNTVPFQCISRSWREGSEVKSACCSCREFRQVQVLEPMPGSSQPPLPRVLRDVKLLSCFLRYLQIMYDIQLHKQYA